MRRAQSDEEPPDEWVWTAEDAERLVLPPRGYGMGIKGNSRNYYDAANSLLPYVRALCCCQNPNKSGHVHQGQLEHLLRRGQLAAAIRASVLRC